MKEGFVAVFHELHPDPAYFPVAGWRSFTTGKSYDQGIVRALRERKLIVDSPSDDDGELSVALEKLHRKLDQPRILYLMLAQGCNFSCRYCPIPNQAARFGEILMSPDIAQRGINLWAEHVRDIGEDAENSVIFYGGEPLLNKPTLQFALTEIRAMKMSGRLPRKTDVMLVTNGTLLDETVLGWCREYGIITMVGIDGYRSSSNSLRTYSDGRDTFAETVAAIRRLVTSHVRVFVSASITPSNLDEIGELTAFLKNLGVERFGLNFLKGRGLADLVPETARGNFERDCAKALVNSYRKDGGSGYEYQVARKVTAFRDRDYFPVDCTCYGNQLVVNADGQISNCPFFKANLGHVGIVARDFRIAKTQIVNEWRKRLPIVNASYRESDAKALCGPGCAWGMFELTGGVEAPDPMTKTFSEEVFNELIWSEFVKA